jgi:phenylacetate-coenzyme A ligase PaaK-like adenylate-forming protein
MTIEKFFEAPCYDLLRPEKQALLTAELSGLTAFHKTACPAYRAILEAYGADAQPGGSDAPCLPVSMFKLHDLASVPPESVFKTMTSSGTTGQRPSKIVLDADTARLQTRALTRIMTSFLGPKRLPMLIIDNPGVVKDRRSFSARGAGILGMMTFGRDHTFALQDEDMAIDWAALDAFAEKYRGQPIVAFGFTFMVWRHFIQALQAAGRKLPFQQATLVHSGGWKKLESEAISNDQFKQSAAEWCGFDHVHNFYGMVEQTGSVFVECEAGHLHAPVFADIVFRDPLDWRECEVGEAGVAQVLSVLPRSYPGHSLLTEDRGVLLGEDDCACGRQGKCFQILGRLPKAEVRGCSDTFTPNA